MRTLFLILLLTLLSTLGHLSDIQPSDTLSLELSQTSPLSASDERTLQREFLLQQFIHRLTTTPPQTILRTQVSWESAATLHHLFESTPQNEAHAGLHIRVPQDPDRAGILGDRRPRRSTFAPPINSCSRVEELGEDQQHCCVDSVIVDFAALGWHFLLSPPTLEFTYCRPVTFIQSQVHRF